MEPMRALRKLGPGVGFDMVDIPIPEVGPDEVLIEVRATSICGTDLHIYEWNPWAADHVKTPITVGHELTGVVADRGANVKEPEIGQLVSVEHGSFGHFLAEWPADDQLGLTAYLVKNGSRLGGHTGQYFLRWVGWDSYILSGDAVLALRDAGLDIAEKPTSKRDLARIQERLNEWAAESGLCYTHISRILAMSIGENYDPESILQRRGDDGE